jgi:hypothetical protein
MTTHRRKDEGQGGRTTRTKYDAETEGDRRRGSRQLEQEDRPEAWWGSASLPLARFCRGRTSLSSEVEGHQTE